MVVVYTQEETIIKESADAVKNDLIRLYGEKLGIEAYAAVKNGRNGTTYRKYGGPLIKVVTKEQALVINEKETAIGMMDQCILS